MRFSFKVCRVNDPDDRRVPAWQRHRHEPRPAWIPLSV
jgi:hypothetical protein